VFPGIELRWMNRSDHWQNLAWFGVSGKPWNAMGELLHTPGSTLTLPTVYHPTSKSPARFAARKSVIKIEDLAMLLKLSGL
jgi:hypothetical protein